MAIPLLLSILSVSQLGGSLQGSRVEIEQSAFASDMESSEGERTLLYLNSCSDGCIFSPGIEDSRQNLSSIISSTKDLTPFPHGALAWQAVFTCVQKLYAPYNVEVTDIDPGQRPHFEAVVAGTPGELGFPRAGGVAPFACSVIPNGISYSFATVYDDMRELCNVVGQESAHVLGLDHEIQCDDPMTYVGGCPEKAFQDVDAVCGEFVERECSCGGETQNSHQEILEVFGAGVTPEVQFTSPLDNGPLPLGFAVSVTATDDFAIARAELYVDGQLREASNNMAVQPQAIADFSFLAPQDLAPGEHEIEVRVFDNRQQFGSALITIEQASCQRSSECDFGYLCVAGQCTLGPDNPGGLGEFCASSDDCAGMKCATDGDYPSVCSATCAPEEGCPVGLSCLQAISGDYVCVRPRPGHNGGFCNASQQQKWPIVMSLFVPLLLAWNKQRYNCGKR